MSILLPQPRLPQTAVPQLMDWGADLVPPGGGQTQRLNRIGSRFALVINYPRLKPEPDGRVLMSAIRQAKFVGALFPFPQPGLVIGSPGSPTVNGNGQLGSSLNLHNFEPGYIVRDGQFFSIIHNGQRYLHHATADTAASTDTTEAMTLPICPMLRISPTDGDMVEFAQPYIEGTLAGNMVAVELAIARSTPASITIAERG